MIAIIEEKPFRCRNLDVFPNYKTKPALEQYLELCVPLAFVSLIVFVRVPLPRRLCKRKSVDKGFCSVVATEERKKRGSYVRSMAHSLNLVNPKAEIAGGGQALALNINAGKGLQNVLKSNLGPRGTMKMYSKKYYC